MESINARDLVLLTGGSPTKTFALLQDIGVQGGISQRQLSYAVSKMNDNVGLAGDDTQLFLAAMNEPVTKVQEKAAAFYQSLQGYFAAMADQHHTDDLAEVYGTVDGKPEPEDLTLPEDGDDDFDMFEAPEPEVKEVVEPSHTITGGGDDELPWDDEGEVDLDFLDEPSVGAEPVTYDRSSLEAEDGPAEVVTDTTPEVVDDLEDLFG